MAKISAHGGATNEAAEAVEVDIKDTQVEPDQVDNETDEQLDEQLVDRDETDSDELDEQLVDRDETDSEQVEQQGPESAPEVFDVEGDAGAEVAPTDDVEQVRQPVTGDPKSAWIEWARYRGEPDPDALTKAELVAKYGAGSE